MVFYLDHRLARVYNPEIDHRVYLHGNIIFGNDFLRLDIEVHGSKTYLNHSIYNRDEEKKPRSLGSD
jgi:hypothetical protein